MTCRDAVRLIAHATEGHASPNALERLVEHLDTCNACRVEAENQVLVKRLLASRPEEPLPDGLAAAISSRLDLEGPIVAPTIDWRTLTIRLLPAAAAIVLAAVFTYRTGVGDNAEPSSLEAFWHQYIYAGQVQISDPEVTNEQVLALLLLDDSAAVGEGGR